MLGFGRIGQQVARRAIGLGMRVVAYDPFVRKSASASSAPSGRRRPTRSYAAAEFLTLHLPLTPETRGSIDAAAIARMPDGARLVNAARGELVDEEALLAALRSGKLAGAALDVFSAEPYSGPAARAGQRRRHAAPRRLDRGGAGSRRRHRRRAGRRGARRAGSSRTRSTSRRSAPRISRCSAPFVPLAAKLGRLAMELAGGRADRIALTYFGNLSDYDTRLLTAAALNGAFQGRFEQPVNYVNAPLLAEERGIEVVEQRRRASRDFTNLVRVGVTADGEELHVAGTTIGRENRHLARQRARLRARDGARAADRLLPLRRRARA